MEGGEEAAAEGEEGGGRGWGGEPGAPAAAAKVPSHVRGQRAAAADHRTATHQQPYSPPPESSQPLTPLASESGAKRRRRRRRKQKVLDGGEVVSIQKNGLMELNAVMEKEACEHALAPEATEISFEELLAQEKSDVAFWQRHKKLSSISSK
ncbi:hypothetical protein ABZP36_028025 [Zizania latifolia]